MTTALMSCIYMFVLAILVGYEVITKVPSTLHTPLMSASNAIHGIVVVGAVIAASQAQTTAGYVLAFVAAFFAAMNVVGGYALTDRMLQMFRKRPGQATGDGGQHREHEAGDGESPVRGDERQRVRGRQLISRHEVRHRCFLRRRPEQGADLEKKRGEHESPHGVDERQGREHQAAADVAAHHDLLAVPTIDEDARELAQEEAGDESRGHDERDRSLG